MKRAFLILLVALAASGVMPVRGHCQSQTLNAFKAQNEQARQKSDYAAMERIGRACMAAGYRDDEMMRWLSISLIQQGKCDEAADVADQNWQMHRSIWSLMQFIDAFSAKGDYKTATAAARFLQKHKSEWGVAATQAEVCLKGVSSWKLHIQWIIDPRKVVAQEEIRPDIRVPIPRNNPPFQISTWRVEGAAATKVEKAAHDVECVRVTPLGVKPFYVIADVEFRPWSYRQAAQNAKEGAYPEDIKKYTERNWAANTDDMIVANLARSLKKPTRYETIVSVLNWCRQNIHHVAIVAPDKDGGGNAAKVITCKYGHCEGMTNASVGLLRACGIPARWIRGHAGVTGEGGCSHHTITEFYVTGIGWIPWDFGCEPFQIPMGYLALWSYNRSEDSVIGAKHLMCIQRLGLNCEYMEAKLVSKGLPDE